MLVFVDEKGTPAIWRELTYIYDARKLPGENNTGRYKKIVRYICDNGLGRKKSEESAN